MFDALIRSLRVRGVVGTVGHIARRLRERGAIDPTVQEGRDADAALDQEFDRTFGVDTGGMIPARRKDIDSANWVHASAYIPMDPIDLPKMLAGTGVDVERSVFVDLGCGKGRVVLLAAGMPWKKVVGVEFSRTLADIARKNLTTYTGNRVCRDVEIVTGDAAEYPWPADPLVVFMYHPFDATVMQRVSDALVATERAVPRRIFVIYWKPVHAEVLDRSPIFTCTVPYHFYDTKPRIGV